MGPISDHQLSICPPFWATQIDLFGPISVYVPGYEKNTRGRNSLSAKCWVMTAVCPVTRLTNLQVIEKTDAPGVVDGFTRLACEVGVPKFVMIDQDSAVVKALQEVEFEYQDTKFKLHTDLGIEFAVCPVSGHNEHGQVERKIRSVQESLTEAGIKSKRLHATGLQTLLKLVENQLNNLPIGFSFGRDQDNTSLLKLISPNMLRVGRINERALDGPMRLPAGSGELLKEVEKIYTSWFRIWNVSHVPKLFHQPKWWKPERDLKEGNVVLFQKETGKEMDNRWSLGRIDQLDVGRDGLARNAIVKYQNASENFARFTDRSVRSLVKIWDIEDQNVDEDLGKLEAKLKNAFATSEILANVINYKEVPSSFSFTSLGLSGKCVCCFSHAKIGYALNVNPENDALDLLEDKNPFELLPTLQADDPFGANVDDLETIDETSCECSFSSLLTSLNLQ